ncbi:conserved hypothetical protein [Tenacibaculum dicentrarchi]|uniref:DUF3592 domain-containing protein n=2 Tax=Tenacibaculum dicentrarchi TaxID=669041 RepID=A0ABM9NZ78_9FLAO|nr:conserved hypothetical protein [Tenacibaculum dicentrarchi]
MHKKITKSLPINLKIRLLYRGFSTIFILILLYFSFLSLKSNMKNIDFRECFYLNINTNETKATITEVYFTDIEDDQFQAMVKAYEFEYTIDKEYHRWVSYNSTANLKIGDEVKIIYNIEKPTYSVIKNFDYIPNGNPFFYYLIFPLITLFIFRLYIRNTVKEITILSNGIITEGRYLGKELYFSNNVKGKYSYRIKFAYFSEDKEIEYATTCLGTIKKIRTKKVWIIYHKNNPKKALVVNSLPKSIAKHIKKNWV